jgi:hypothetical protein
MIKKLIRSFQNLFRVLGISLLYTVILSFIIVFIGGLVFGTLYILSYFNLTYAATICIGIFALLFILCFLIFGINEIINIKNGY